MPWAIVQNHDLWRFRAPLSATEIRRTERWLASARVALTIAALVTMVMEPGRATYSRWLLWLLIVYLTHATLVMLLVRVRPQSTFAFRSRIGALLIARDEPLALRHYPDLQEMHPLVLRRIVFAVGDAGAGGHPLNFARANNSARAETVLVLKCAVQHVTDDFHVPMAVWRKASLRRHPVFIDDSEAAESHMGRIVIFAKREAVPAVEPAEPGAATGVAWANCQHSTSRSRACLARRSRQRRYVVSRRAMRNKLRIRNRSTGRRAVSERVHQ